MSGNKFYNIAERNPFWKKKLCPEIKMCQFSAEKL